VPDVIRSVRLIVVYHYGGLYMDLDVEIFVPLDDLFLSWGFNPSQHDLVCIIEYILQADQVLGGMSSPIRSGVPEFQLRLSNFMFYGTHSKNSLALENVLALVLYRAARLEALIRQGGAGGAEILSADYTTIYTTGPDAMTEAIVGGPLGVLPRVLLAERDKEDMRHRSSGTWKDKRDKKARKGTRKGTP
jgi:hypothetical protein